MNISELFIRRPVMTTLVMIAILAAGILGYRLLPVSDLPNVDFPTISVSANLTGASPETMAAAVGLIGTMHAVGATGIFQGVECLWQIQGKYDKFHGDPRIWKSFGKKKPEDWRSLQLPDARQALWISHAGVGSHVTVGILRKAF